MAVSTGAVVLHEQGWPVGSIGLSAVLGGIIFLVTILLGPASGGHINPTVTLGLFAIKGVYKRKLAAYSAAQVGGAVLGSVAVLLIIGRGDTLGQSVPKAGILPAAFAEFVLTAVQMSVILGSRTFKNRILKAGLISLVVAVESFFFTDISGASMNPARTLGPAIVAGGTIGYVVPYLMAQMAGAVVAALGYQKLTRRNLRKRS